MWPREIKQLSLIYFITHLPQTGHSTVMSPAPHALDERGGRLFGCVEAPGAAFA